MVVLFRKNIYFTCQEKCVRRLELLYRGFFCSCEGKKC